MPKQWKCGYISGTFGPGYLIVIFQNVGTFLYRDESTFLGNKWNASKVKNVDTFLYPI